jgi:GDP-4-dehydro-6-deoxy-D-mannose reductase
MSEPTILITGGTGFAGSHLVDFLLERGVSPSNLHITHYGKNLSEANPKLISSNVHNLNLTNEQATKDLIKKINPNQVYHLAAIATVGSSFESPAKTLTINTQLQLSLLEALRLFAPQAKTLIIGSAQEYDFNSFKTDEPVSETHPLGPANPYGVSKVDQDLLGLAYYYSYQLPIIRVRPFNHIGERQTPDFVVPALARQIANFDLLHQKQDKQLPQTHNLKVGNLDSIRDFCDVKDMVSAYQTLMDHGQIGAVYNVGSGVGYSIRQLLNLLLKQTQAKISVEVDPTLIRPVDVPKIVADTRKISELGWSPKIPITQTLQRIMDYWKQNLATEN